LAARFVLLADDWVNAERIQNPTMTSLPNRSPASSGAERMMVHVVKTNGNQPTARQCFASRRRFWGVGTEFLDGSDDVWRPAVLAQHDEPRDRQPGAPRPGFPLAAGDQGWNTQPAQERELASPWRGRASRLCPSTGKKRRNAVQGLAALASAAPMMPGAEYLTAEVLGALWEAIGAAFTVE
jgi:hypothetical protein